MGTETVPETLPETLVAQGLSLAGRLAKGAGGVSAAFCAGAVTAICGPNGAGKSTLLACLAGILPPDGGEVLLGGEALSGMPARLRALDGAALDKAAQDWLQPEGLTFVVVGDAKLVVPQLQGLGMPVEVVKAGG